MTALAGSLPKISIITPSFNQAQFLEECIDSILCQNYPNLEYIIMDGGSTDGSVEIIKKYEKYLTYWQSQYDGGQYQAICAGFERSTGEIMAWQNSDDKYHKDAFKIAAHIFNNFPKVEWIVGRYTAWNEDGSLHSVFPDIIRWDRHRHLDENQKNFFIQQESVFWKRSLWNKAGAVMRTELNYAGDFELWTRFFRFAKLYSVDALLAGYRYQPKQKVALFHDGMENEGFQHYLSEVRAIIQGELNMIQRGQYNKFPLAPDIISISQVPQYSI